MAQKLRAAKLDAVVLNGWGDARRRRSCCSWRPRSGESWGEFAWTAESVGSIVYLAVFGSAVTFVALTVLLRQLTAQAMSFLAMLLPFGRPDLRRRALRRGYHLAALAGALLVAAAC